MKHVRFGPNAVKNIDHLTANNFHNLPFKEARRSKESHSPERGNGKREGTGRERREERGERSENLPFPRGLCY